MEIQYALKRAELAKHFWLHWRRSAKIRSFHLNAIVASIVIYFLFRAPKGAFRVADLLVIPSAVVILLTISFLYPQVKFKSQMRTLELTESGIKTQIAELSEIIPWAQIENYSVSAGTIHVVGTSQNALFIPERAFSSETQRTLFLQVLSTYTKQAA